MTTIWDGQHSKVVAIILEFGPIFMCGVAFFLSILFYWSKDGVIHFFVCKWKD